MTTDQEAPAEHGTTTDLSTADRRSVAGNHGTADDYGATDHESTADHGTATDLSAADYGTVTDGNGTAAEEGIAMRPFSESLPMSLLKARESAMRILRPLLAEHGLTEQQWRVLRAPEP